MSNIALSLTMSGTSLHISSRGSWLHHSIGEIVSTVDKYTLPKEIDSVAWDFSGMEDIDASGAILILRLMRKLRSSDATFTFTGMTPEHQRMFLFYRKNSSLPDEPGVHDPGLIEKTGRGTVELLLGFGKYLNFIGEIFYNLYRTILHPTLFRFAAAVKNTETSGLQALPIIALTAFLIGLVIAYQSAEQLAQFGANIFIVEMVSISVFRELSPMIAAIVVAGRSASAYTAELGTMKITEEIDAMRTMGFDPQQFLILPRVIALMLSMPLIVFFSDMVGVFGGMIIAKFQLGINFTEFINRMYTEVPIKHMMIGLIKAPIFGFIIASIGCFRGLQVTGSTDSIGYFTTVSVVNAIFWVIASNALISVFLTELGI